MSHAHARGQILDRHWTCRHFRPLSCLDLGLHRFASEKTGYHHRCQSYQGWNSLRSPHIRQRLSAVSARVFLTPVSLAVLPSPPQLCQVYLCHSAYFHIRLSPLAHSKFHSKAMEHGHNFRPLIWTTQTSPRYFRSTSWCTDSPCDCK